jgi:hypothetical protein
MASGIPGEKPVSNREYVVSSSSRHDRQPQGQSAVARGKARSTDEETDPRSFVQPLLPQGRIGASTTPKEETEGWERVRQASFIFNCLVEGAIFLADFLHH